MEAAKLQLSLVEMEWVEPLETSRTVQMEAQEELGQGRNPDALVSLERHQRACSVLRSPGGVTSSQLGFCVLGTSGRPLVSNKLSASRRRSSAMGFRAGTVDSAANFEGHN